MVKSEAQIPRHHASLTFVLLSSIRSVSSQRRAITSVKWDFGTLGQDADRPGRAPLGTAVDMTCSTSVHNRGTS